MVVKTKTFLALNSYTSLDQAAIDALSTQLNGFLATITPINVLDIVSTYSAPAGQFTGRGSVFTCTVVYQE